METNNIDSLIKKVIDESSDFYTQQANAAKNSIWQQVQTPAKKRSGLFLIYSLAAACVTLLILSSILGLSLINSKKSSDSINKNTFSCLVADYSKRKVFDDDSMNNNMAVSVDTIYILKTQIVYQPVEVLSYNIDTVYIPQIIYETIMIKNDSLVANESDLNTFTDNKNDVPVNNNEIIISNNDSDK